MKKKTIIKVLKTINNICYSSSGCGSCGFKRNCPYSPSDMYDTNKTRFVANRIKNIIDNERRTNK